MGVGMVMMSVVLSMMMVMIMDRACFMGMVMTGTDTFDMVMMALLRQADLSLETQ